MRNLFLATTMIIMSIFWQSCSKDPQEPWPPVNTKRVVWIPTYIIDKFYDYLAIHGKSGYFEYADSLKQGFFLFRSHYTNAFPADTTTAKKYLLDDVKKQFNYVFKNMHDSTFLKAYDMVTEEEYKGGTLTIHYNLADSVFRK